MTGADHDLQLHSISHGVVSLERLGREYGPFRRQLAVLKLRGVPFQEGSHDYIIEGGGLKVFPRLVAGEHRGEYDRSGFQSGIAELDRLLGGALHRGTSTLIIGPAGAGKSRGARADQWVRPGSALLLRFTLRFPNPFKHSTSFMPF